MVKVDQWDALNVLVNKHSTTLAKHADRWHTDDDGGGKAEHGP